MKIIIFGVGGVGGRVADLAVRLPGLETLALVDGDLFEEKNLDRQLGVLPGKAKVHALKDFLKPKSPEKLEIVPIHGFVGNDVADEPVLELLSDPKDEFAVVMTVDNIQARRRILDAFQRGDWPAAKVLVAGGNEYWDGHALAQLPSWKGGKADYYSMYPDTRTREDGYDPARPSCTEEAQESSPQLALTNATVAVCILQLLTFYLVHLNEELSNHVQNNPDLPTLPLETWFAMGEFTKTTRTNLKGNIII